MTLIEEAITAEKLARTGEETTRMLRTRSMDLLRQAVDAAPTPEAKDAVVAQFVEVFAS